MNNAVHAIEQLKATINAAMLEEAETALLPAGYSFITEHKSTAFSADGSGPAHIRHVSIGQWQAGVMCNGARVAGPIASTPRDAVDALHATLLDTARSL